MFKFLSKVRLSDAPGKQGCLKFKNCSNSVRIFPKRNRDWNVKNTKHSDKLDLSSNFKPVESWWKTEKNWFLILVFGSFQYVKVFKLTFSISSLITTYCLLVQEENVTMTSQEEGAKRGRIKSRRLRSGTFHLFSQWFELSLSLNWLEWAR